MIRLLALLILLCAPALATAHALDPGYLDLRAQGQDQYRVLWRVPDVEGIAIPLTARLPESCTHEPPPPPVFDGQGWVSGWIATCPSGLAGGDIAIGGLDVNPTDVLLRIETAPGQMQLHRLTPGNPVFTVPEQAGPAEIAASYVSLGVTHILEGIDHLMFVLALMLLIGPTRRLFWAITAFTLAHSITLALAALNILTLPPPPVEAVIALSIVFLAYELTLPPQARDPVTERLPWVVSFAFGLIHGLGFAGALREIGLPQGDVPLALFAFNLGVELGQVLFVGAVLGVGLALRRLYPDLVAWRFRLTRVAAYGIGTLASYWVIARIAAF